VVCLSARASGRRSAARPDSPPCGAVVCGLRRRPAAALESSPRPACPSKSTGQRCRCIRGLATVLDRACGHTVEDLFFMRGSFGGFFVYRSLAPGSAAPRSRACCAGTRCRFLMGTHLTTFFHRFHCSVSDIIRVRRYGEHMSAAAAHGACNGCMTSRAAPGSVGPWSVIGQRSGFQQSVGPVRAPGANTCKRVRRCGAAISVTVLLDGKHAVSKSPSCHT